MGAADSPTIRYRRHKRRLAIHAGVFAIVNAFFVGQWLLLRNERLEGIDPRDLASFWPVWLMLLWGVFLGIHGLYVWSRKPIVEVEPAPVSWRTGRAVRTVVFTDIVGSTERARELGDRGWRSLLQRHDRLADELAKRYRGRVMKHMGDGQLAVFESPNEAIRFAEALREELRGVGLAVRVGMHVGEVDLQRRDVAGIGVHIASRVMSEAEPSQILVSRTVRDLVGGSDIAFVDAGTRQLKGFEGEWQLFAVADARGER
ncbi:MAG TPA: adenylate/guanylate cyclase domain-containing protein [Actinomycetota bacterium]|nr:adenylate/guanylate cyclase domain-containing protein [Actinomycetota bacterium]